MAIVFRLYDEGLAFRYQLGKTPGAPEKLTIDADLSEFRFAQDGTAWSYNGERENKGPEPLSGITGKKRLPMTVRFADGAHAAVLEAVIRNFAWLDVAAKEGKLAFQTVLEKSTGTLPFDTPWRVILVGDSPGELVDASVLENLSPPCAIEDPTWVKPGGKLRLLQPL